MVSNIPDFIETRGIGAFQVENLLDGSGSHCGEASWRFIVLRGLASFDDHFAFNKNRYNAFRTCMVNNYIPIVKEPPPNLAEYISCCVKIGQKNTLDTKGKDSISAIHAVIGNFINYSI